MTLYESYPPSPAPSSKLPSRGLVGGRNFIYWFSIPFLSNCISALPLRPAPSLFSLAVLLRLLNTHWAFLVGPDCNISRISLLTPFLIAWHTPCCFLLGGELEDLLIPYRHLKGTGNPAECWWQKGTLLIREAGRWKGSRGQVFKGMKKARPP